MTLPSVEQRLEDTAPGGELNPETRDRGIADGILHQAAPPKPVSPTHTDTPHLSPVPKARQPEQAWSDGCTYEGDLKDGQKHGFGVFRWGNGESYEGDFYKDHRHGDGIYSWTDGVKFIGKFYLDRKEGYGTIEMNDGSVFQGLYKSDERFGPGVLTYPNGHQDVGLWYRDHLIKLCTALPRKFTMKNHPYYHPIIKKNTLVINPSEEEKYVWRRDPNTDPFFYPFKKLLFDDKYTLPQNIEQYSNDCDHLPLTYSFKDDCDKYFFKKDYRIRIAEGNQEIDLLNNTPLLIKMQKHIHRHRHSQKKLQWNATAVIEGIREGFGPKGILECNAEKLISAAGNGNFKKVKEILKANLASADVADLNGNTPLIAASIICHNNIINFLLDNGANVNKLDDESTTALISCNTLYYPIDSFQFEIPAQLNSSTEMDKPLTTDLNTEILHVYDQQIKLGTLNRVRSLHADQHLNQKHIELFEQSLEESEDIIEHEAKEDQYEINIGSATSQPFESFEALHDFSIDVSNKKLQYAAEILSRNAMFNRLIEEQGSSKHDMAEIVWKMAQMKSEHRKRKKTIKLLLHRGADPNIFTDPMQTIFFPVLAADVSGVKLLLETGVNTNIRFPKKSQGLLVGGGIDQTSKVSGVQQLIGFEVKSLNHSGVPPHYFDQPAIIPPNVGRSPLHIAAQRDDDYKNAHEIVQQLLTHNANPNTLWSGHSPLSLAIGSGNDLAVDELLNNRANVNLPLGNGVGSALASALNPTYEHRRSMQDRLALVDKLIRAGANILMPITIAHGDNMTVGTAVDYAYFKFFQDQKIAQTPYHALTPEEREIFNNRRQLLKRLGGPLRHAAILKEKKRIDELAKVDKQDGVEGQPNQISLTAKAILHRYSVVGDLKEYPTQKEFAETWQSMKDNQLQRQPLFLFKFCYNCGRSVGVRLTLCSRCKEVYYCSRACKLTAWEEFHKYECKRFRAQPKIKKKDTSGEQQQKVTKKPPIDNYSFN
ncbi:ankyrin repeat and MYND domain-containing protein 1 isoform X1 [Callorhinchus milii]|uniref:ankyrin repeat and MYND domain-containing protein 1 isoform X1 n=1 Tax=Callorhinchus milii TaxID=7868 RepID=UPI0004572A65|nr:ankyrin repeat and MYND domain-containing protein 1 isoform X1 [Callorhinchus milii]|eukprot:gi/632934538/ref/XP_007885370.1/ PREDICTED: ankyrin repeat and MYND domain-containing protein 1 isoform X2 [Callorhinchus milii]